MNDVTRILSRIEDGDAQAAEQLLPLVYEELRKLAAHKLAEEKLGQTLQATALVHEAYLRLVDVAKVQHWNSRGHFFAAAAEAMRRILIENARRKKRLRHGAGWKRIDIDPQLPELTGQVSGDDLLAIHEALDEMERVDSQAASVVKLRYFLGLPFAEVAQLMGISERTAYRNWSYARTWMYRYLGERIR